ncbi:hypothetical protein ACQKII_19265 [Lysinibacillus sp. NPDC048646]|uniref:hypothetical protein n=1 Tax=Lysinibacillus sp. NPDC048646 TaxID=3390574 RepID=UPI003D036E1A
MFIQPEWLWKQENGSGMHQWIKQKENPHPNDVDIIVYGAYYRMQVSCPKKHSIHRLFARHGQVFNLII